MTLKTITGPSIREALADARRLFGAGVVLLQSAPAAHGQPATVTVGFDVEPPRPPVTLRPRPAPPAHPEPLAAPAPRAYGYAATRKIAPPVTEPVSAAPPPAPPPVAPISTPPAAVSVPAGASPAPAPSAGSPDASAEVERLRERLADVEGLLADLRRAAPAPRPARPPVVFVGPAGSGKTSLALRLATTPDLVGAASTAAIVVAPTHDRFVDPAPLFWAAGVPVAVVRTADDVAEALRQFEGADRIVVDTPPLPLQPAQARPVVARLGALLAPLGAVEVCLAVDATRAAATLTAGTLAATGLRPDMLALTRLDELADPAPGTPDAAGAWARALALPLRWVTAGPEPEDLTRASPLEPPLLTPSEPDAPLSPPPSTNLSSLVTLVLESHQRAEIDTPIYA